MSKIVCGIDCEVHDPKLKTAGWSWKYHEGYILCTSIFYENLDEVKIIPGIHNDSDCHLRLYAIAFRPVLAKQHWPRLYNRLLIDFLNFAE